MKLPLGKLTWIFTVAFACNALALSLKPLFDYEVLALLKKGGTVKIGYIKEIKRIRGITIKNEERMTSLEHLFGDTAIPGHLWGDGFKRIEIIEKDESEVVFKVNDENDSICKILDTLLPSTAKYLSSVSKRFVIQFVNEVASDYYELSYFYLNAEDQVSPEERIELIQMYLNGLTPRSDKEVKYFKYLRNEVDN